MSRIAFIVALWLISTARVHAQEPPPPLHEGVVIARDVMVPMRDGVRLATDIYRPAKDGEAIAEPFPTLLSRTPYGKKGSEETATFLAKRGYTVVVQDVRGRFDSEGDFYIYLDEGEDGYVAVEWAAGQPWSTGEVGTFGGSYLAATQHALAALHPPSLRAMFVRVSTSNYLEDGAGAGGAFALLHNLAYALNLASSSKEAAKDPARAQALKQALEPKNLEHWLRAYPYRPNASPVAPISSYQQWFQDWVDHASFDDYWKQNGYTFELSYDDYPDIPIYHVGGWYDLFLRGTLNNHAGLDARHESDTRLLIGPWEHGVGPRVTGDVDFAESAKVDMKLERLFWFDTVFKGRAPSSEPPVKLFIMGGGDGTKTADGHLNHGGEWTSVASWPPPESSPSSFYLHGDGRLSLELPAAEAEPTHFVYDPADPVPSIGGKINSGDALVPSGPWNQRCVVGRVTGCKNDLPLSARRDVLVFQTPPLEEDVTVMGAMTVKLWVASSAKDTDFTAKLVDVYPPSEHYPEGYDLLIANRIQRARFRNGLEKEELLEPGQVFELTIDLLGVANRFVEGHRIRVDISSSNFPFFDVNPNTGERLGHQTHMVKAQNTVYHDAARPSHIVLPLVPATDATDQP